MERLTERDEFGNADIIALSDVIPELYAELSFSETNALTDALNRLAAYEDTGLTPERAQELAQAEKDGRLVVLPPNAQLTPEELREMDGEPVWNDTMKKYALVDAGWWDGIGRTVDSRGKWRELDDRYYRRKPEEGVSYD